MALAQEDIIVRYLSEGYEQVIREILEADKSVDKLQKTVSQTESVAGRAGKALSEGFGKAVKDIARDAGVSDQQLSSLQRIFTTIQNATVRGARGIGDFARSLSGARSNATGMVRILSALRVGMIAFNVATGGLVLAITAFIALPLIAFFKRTSDGADSLRRVFAGLQAVAQTLGDRFGYIGRQIANLDFRGAINSFKQLFTGLRDVREEGERVAQLFIDLAEEQRDFTVQSAKTRQEIARLKLEARLEDEGPASNRQIQALERAIQLTIGLGEQEARLSQRRLEAIRAEVAARGVELTSEEKDRIAEAEVELLNLQTKNLNEQAALIRRLNSLKRRGRDEDKKVAEDLFGTLEGFQQQLRDVEQIISRTKVDSPLLDELLEDAENLQKIINDILLKIALGSVAEGSERALQIQLAFLQNQLSGIDRTRFPDLFEDVLAKIRRVQDELDKITLDKLTGREKIREEINQLQQSLERLKIDDPDAYRQTEARIRELQKILEELELQSRQAFEPLAEIDTLDLGGLAGNIADAFADLTSRGTAELQALLERIPQLGLDEAIERGLTEKVREAIEELGRLGFAAEDGLNQSARAFDRFLASRPEESLLGKLFGATPEEAQKIRDSIALLLDSVAEGIDSITEQQISALDRRIEAQKQRVDDVVKIADRGNAELLESEEDKLAKLQEMRERAVRRQQQLAAIQIAVNQAVAISEAIRAIASAAQFGPAAPFIIAANIAAIVAGLAAATIAIRNAFGDLPTFYEGAESVAESLQKRKARVIDMTRGKEKVQGPAGRDQIVARVSKGERILTDKQNKPLLRWGVKNKDIPALVGLALGKIEMAPLKSVRAPMVSGPPRWKDGDAKGAIHSDAYLLRLEIKKLVKEQQQTRRALEDLKIETGVNKEAIYAIVRGRNEADTYRKRLMR